MTHWKRPWFWERLKAGGEREDRGNDWMASPTQWTWVSANSGRWWRTGKPGMLQSVGSQRIRDDWLTEQQQRDNHTKGSKWERQISYGITQEWCWNSSTLATSCEQLTHWKRLWCWEGLGAGGEGDDRGWDGWMASPTRWMWVWVTSGSWWWTGRPGVLWFMGSQRVGHNWVTELNWTVDHLYVKSKVWCKWTYLWNRNRLRT